MVDPGSVISIVPAHAHVHVDPFVSAFCVPNETASEPFDQGPVTTGTHGMGVNVPPAEEVAEAT